MHKMDTYREGHPEKPDMLGSYQSLKDTANPSLPLQPLEVRNPAPGLFANVVYNMSHLRIQAEMHALV